MTGLSFDELVQHLWECGVGIIAAEEFRPLVVIRTETHDHGVAAVHVDREQNKLVIDLGQKVREP